MDSNNKHHALLPSLRTFGHVQVLPTYIPFAICAAHNQEIGQYCKTHQLPLCDFCFQEHTYADPQMGGFGSNHEFVKIDKIINDAIDHMSKQLQTFDHFIQTKKNMLNHVKQDQVIQFMNDDRLFEDAHNHMINRLMHYKNLPNNEKIYYLQSSLSDFDNYYNQACAAKQKILEFSEKSQAAAKEQVQSVGEVSHLKEKLTLPQNQSLSGDINNDNFSKSNEELKLNNPESGMFGNGANGHLGITSLNQSGLEELKDGDALRRKYSKKKHYPISLSVEFPGQEEQFKIQPNSSFKVKQLKQLIKEKVGADHNPDQYQLQVEGGEVLKKSQATLDDCGLKDGAVILVEILEKAVNSSYPRVKKVSKEDPKLPVFFTLKKSEMEEESVEPLQGKVEVQRHVRVKQLRKMIQDELGIQDKVQVKLYLEENNEEVTDDKLSLEDSKILPEGAAQGNLQVAIIQTVHIEVHGKGKDYTAKVEVQPTDPIEILKTRVHFFKMFTQRKHLLYDKKSDSQIEDFSKSFKDYDLKDGAQLIMREAGKSNPKPKIQQFEEVKQNEIKQE